MLMQEALLKSNEVFETFKQEIEKVGIHTFDISYPVFQACYASASLSQAVVGTENKLIIFCCSLCGSRWKNL